MARRRHESKACSHMFSVTSGTVFSSRKMPIRTLLLAMAIFVNGVKGYAALQMSRDLDCQYKTAFVLCHKLREALTSEVSDATLAGEVEVDGAYFGGHVRPANKVEDRVDRRLAMNQTGKRQVVVVLRERLGITLPFVFKTEAQSMETICARITRGSTVYADEAPSWNLLYERFLTKRINHQEAYSDGEACTNQAESFFSRLRRAEVGTHHHIAGPYLAAYSGEIAWREDNRRVSNGEQYLMVAAAGLGHGVSRVWKGYWQKTQSSSAIAL